MPVTLQEIEEQYRFQSEQLLDLIKRRDKFVEILKISQVQEQKSLRTAIKILEAAIEISETLLVMTGNILEQALEMSKKSDNTSFEIDVSNIGTLKELADEFAGINEVIEAHYYGKIKTISH